MSTANVRRVLLLVFLVARPAQAAPKPMVGEVPPVAGVLAAAAAATSSMVGLLAAHSVLTSAPPNSGTIWEQQAEPPTSEANLVPETSHSIMFPDATLKFEAAASAQTSDGAELSCV